MDLISIRKTVTAPQQAINPLIRTGARANSASAA
jgi:hypothetical protein